MPADWAGNYDQLIDDAKAGKIHNVYIAMQMKDESRIKQLMRELADTTCSVILIPDVFTFNILHSRIEEVNGVPVVPLYDTPLSGINRVLKRLEDIVLSSLILLLISPVLCCIALAVKLSSPGPVIFRQTRYGMDGKPIMVWKFRSMKVMENDKVVTRPRRTIRASPAWGTSCAAPRWTSCRSLSTSLPAGCRLLARVRTRWRITSSTAR